MTCGADSGRSGSFCCDATASRMQALQHALLRRRWRTRQRVRNHLILCRGSADGVVFEDTSVRKKPIVFPYRSRPFTGGVNAGVEEVLADMKAGGKRRCTVPPSMGFGDKPFSLKATLHASDKQGVVPPGSTLEYELTLVRVSIAPS